jgi:NAD(P)-dependent dehydrogenase (short-subunit alcohol dehydrogenase family)
MHITKLFDLTGQVALVTGGYGIYGFPISEALAEAGAHVVIAARGESRCREAASTMEERGLQVSAETYDQADEDSILALRQRLAERFGSVDVLVNNAVSRPVHDHDASLARWRESMEVNATGLFAVCRAFLEPMMERGSGCAINIGSIQSVAAPRFALYDGTDMTTPPDYHFHKHGLIGLTKYLAAWAGPRNVRVNAVSPGGFDTGEAPESCRTRYNQHTLLGRMAGSDDIKGAVVFLASAAAAYVTGENIVVDGGYSC